MSTLSPYFAWWRTTVATDREIVDAEVLEEHRGPSPALAEALEGWPGTYYWAEGDGDGRLVLIRSLAPAPRERWWLHGLLFLVTFLTVWMGGALLSGHADSVPVVLTPDASLAAHLLEGWLRELTTRGPGLDFAMALMAILLAHETGHYIVAKRYSINTSLPYFLPAPPMWNFIGTFGAFIRLRSPVVDRRQLMDVGAAGPWAGFVVAAVALVVGLARSTVLPTDGPSGQLVMFGNLQLFLGDSPFMYALRELIVGDGTVLLHPLAFAGWLGLFVTMLNLIPLGQLDGGHVLYALLGRWQARLGVVVWLGLVVLGIVSARHGLLQGMLWWVWAALIIMLGRGRLAHPQVLDRERPLPSNRRPLGWATVVLLILTFTPIPIHYS